jgi:phage gpG-like protein
MAYQITFGQLDEILENQVALMEVAGELVVSMTQAHFEDQEFNGVPWVERYPNQDSDKINVAGALMDFNLGNTKPHKRRFQARPVLGGGGGAMAMGIQITSLSKDRVEVDMTGPASEYANIHHFGGISTISISSGGADRLMTWLNSKQGENYRQHFATLVDFTLEDVDEFHETEVNARPFMGLSDSEITDLASDLGRAMASL